MTITAYPRIELSPRPLFDIYDWILNLILTGDFHTAQDWHYWYYERFLHPFDDYAWVVTIESEAISVKT